MQNNSLATQFAVRFTSVLTARAIALVAIALLSVTNVNSGIAQEAVPQEAVPQDVGDEAPASESVVAAPSLRVGPEHFIRLREDERGRVTAMETSVTRYELKNSDGERVVVDLLGVVHIGELEYYQQFNKRFEQYESLLYELVAPKGTVIPKGGREAGGIVNPIAMLQKGMQETTQLEFQLEHVDYTKANFVHADMSPEEFAESMAENGESIAGFALKAMAMSQAMEAKSKKNQAVSMMIAMFSSNRTMRLRRIMAKQIREMESGMMIFEGKDGSTIIDRRNAKCMEVLQEQIDAGKTSLGIFYGAGHLDDMDRRLRQDFGAKRGGQYWMTAWKLR